MSCDVCRLLNCCVCVSFDSLRLVIVCFKSEIVSPSLENKYEEAGDWIDNGIGGSLVVDVDLPCHDLRDHRDGVPELADAESDILSSQASNRPTDFVRRNCIVFFIKLLPSTRTAFYCSSDCSTTQYNLSIKDNNAV